MNSRVLTTFFVSALIFGSSTVMSINAAINKYNSSEGNFLDEIHYNDSISSNNSSEVQIIKPQNGIYIFGIKILPILGQIVIGRVTVEVDASEDTERVEFLLKPKCGCRLDVMFNDTERPFAWNWNENSARVFDEGLVALKVKGYNKTLNTTEDDMILLRFKL